jgi:hypothetical protein
MLQRIEIVCFAASYAVALGLELSRLCFRAGLRGMLMLAFVAAGLLAQTLFLLHRAAVMKVPLSSPFDWYLMAAWIMAAVYLYLAYYHPKNPIGLFILPLVLGLIAVAALAADREPFPATIASRYWGALHGAFLLLGTVAVLLGFVAGVMYLIQAYRLKHKLLPRPGFQLPSLEWLARFNVRAIITSLAMLALGVLSGAILNLVHRDPHADQIPWSDPIVLSSTVTVVWLVVAVVFAVVYKPARQGRKVAYLTLVSFVFLVVSLAVALFVDSQHGNSGKSLVGQAPGARQPIKPPRPARASSVGTLRRQSKSLGTGGPEDTSPKHQRETTRARYEPCASPPGAVGAPPRSTCGLALPDCPLPAPRFLFSYCIFSFAFCVPRSPLSSRRTPR